MSKALIKRAKSFSTQKSLGQNFLVNEEILEGIVNVSDLDKENDLVLEIGAGIGFLTERLVDKAKHLFSVELDASTEIIHKTTELNNPNFSFIRGDCLAIQLVDLLSEHLSKSSKPDEDLKSSKAKKVKIVANLPYQITSKILIHLLGDMESMTTADPSHNRNYLSDIYILVQKEFADKLCAKPGTKPYGSMTLLVNYWAEVERLIDVPFTAFHPRPKVDSTFIRISPRRDEDGNLKPVLDFEDPDEDPRKLRRFIKAIFANRRKKLANGLKAAGYDKEIIDSLELGNLRGETMTIHEIYELVKKIDKKVGTCSGKFKD